MQNNVGSAVLDHQVHLRAHAQGVHDLGAQVLAHGGAIVESVLVGAQFFDEPGLSFLLAAEKAVVHFSRPGHLLKGIQIPLAVGGVQEAGVAGRG